jgi:hypothetical protein
MSTATRMNLPIACQMNLRYREGCRLKRPLHYSHTHPCPSTKTERGVGRGTKRQRIASGEFWRAVLPHCRKISSHQGLEGRAPARPQSFGTAGAVPSRIFLRMNSALRKIRQIPCPLSRAPCPSLAEASGMKFGLVVQRSNLWCWLRSVTRLHTCTHAHLHA